MTSQSYTNDANGNTLTGGGRVNTWDSQNRLVKVVKDGITSEFTYGCDGLRRRSVVTKANGEQTKTDYVLDGQSVVQEVVAHRANATSTWGVASGVSYLQGPSGPLYRHVSGTTDVSWYLYDGLGSVVGEVDVTGNVTATKDHDVYGLTRSVTGTPTSRHGFVGQLGHTEDDETGYVYMRARHYDPELGRFASQDPALQGMNWFTYCNNDPINNVDADGKEPSTSTILFGVAIALAMVGFDMLAGVASIGGFQASYLLMAGLVGASEAIAGTIGMICLPAALLGGLGNLKNTIESITRCVYQAQRISQIGGGKAGQAMAGYLLICMAVIVGMDAESMSLDGR